MHLPSEATTKTPTWLWKLPTVTALVLSLGTLGAVIVSISLRPAPAYLLPLLVDIADHTPESHLLLGTLLSSIVLLVGTVTTCSAYVCYLQTITRRRKTLLISLGIISTIPLLSSSVRLLVIERPVYSASFFVWALSFAWLSNFRHGLKSQIASIFDDVNQLHLPNEMNNLFFSTTPVWARTLQRWMTDFCVSGNWVCAFKIFGLWMALDNFSIAQRHYIRLGILCTLAFVEYTAVLLFCIFLCMIAIDLRVLSISCKAAAHRNSSSVGDLNEEA